MGSYTKTTKGWRVQLMHKGKRHSTTVRTKAAGHAWEAAILHENETPAINKTFGDLLKRYSAEVSEHKRGRRWEQIRIDKLLRDDIAKAKLADLTASHFASWRDRMLAGGLSAASVRREWNVMNPALNIAVKEWRWLPSNPMSDVRRPKPPQARDRRISQDEIDRLLYALGYEHTEKPATMMARVGAAFLFSIETAMRAGEVCKLRMQQVDVKVRTARLAMTKNGTARTVALSAEAVRIIGQMDVDHGPVFGLTTASIDALFRKAKSRALIADLHWHDTRHEAITRLSKKLDVLDLARMVGIRDLKILLVYYNATAAEIAQRL